MKLNFYIEFLTLGTFLFFLIINFINIEENNKTNRFIYLSYILFIVFVNLIYYSLIYSSQTNSLYLVTSLLIVIFFIIHFIMSLFSKDYVRLRLLFIPFFFILISFRYLTSFESDNSNNATILFEDNYLLIHIFSSLFSYTMLTISAVSAFCVNIKSKFLKKITYSNPFLNLLPSVYESEVISIKFLYFTAFFLTLSLISGFTYHNIEYNNFYFFFNNKVILSIVSLVLIFIFLIFHRLNGFTALVTFKVILLSYLFINLAYFGIKVLE